MNGCATASGPSSSGNEKSQRRSTYRELKTLGASEDVAKQVADNCHCWWRNSAKLLNSIMTIAYFEGLRLPRLS